MPPTGSLPLLNDVMDRSAAEKELALSSIYACVDCYSAMDPRGPAESDRSEAERDRILDRLGDSG